MQIDHLVYATPDLATAIDDLEARLGVRAELGGKHVGRGTHNALLALGAGSYLEIIAPDPEQPRPSGPPRPFGLDDLDRARLAGWAVTCVDIDAAIAAARAHGYDPGDAVGMQRIGPTGTMLEWRLTLNSLGGGPVPFLISWGDTEHPSRSAPSGLVLDSFAIEHPEPATLVPILTALDVHLAVTRAGEPALVARVRGPNGIEELR